MIERAAAAAAIPDAHDKDLMYRSILVSLVLIIRQAIREDGLGKPTSTNALVATVTIYIHQHYRNPDLTVTKDRKSTRLNSSHSGESRMPSSA